MNFDRIKEKLEILADVLNTTFPALRVAEIVKNKGGLGNSHREFVTLYRRWQMYFFAQNSLDQSLHLRLFYIVFPENQTT